MPIVVCFVLSIALVCAVHVFDSIAATGLPLAALVGAAGIAFLFDERARPVTNVSPRGGVWALALRCAAAALLLCILVAVFLTVPSNVRGEGLGWILVLTALTALVLMADLSGVRRGVLNPGVFVAPAVVLAGIAPLVIGLFVDWASPYPQPALGGAWGLIWMVGGLLGVFGSVVLIFGRTA
jgi:hypothetical protein